MMSVIFGLKPTPFLQLDDFLVAQEKQYPTAIRGIVRDRNRAAVRDIRPALVLLRIDPDREIDRQAHRLDLVAAIGFLVIEIGLVLKRIGLKFAGVERGVRHHIVRELDQLNIEPLLRGDRLHGFEDLGMRPRRDANLDDFRRGTRRPGGEYRRGNQNRTKRHFGLR